MQQIPITAKLIVDNLQPVLLLGFTSFVVSMLLTPVYTALAFRFQWWKRQRLDSTTGEKAVVFSKMHAEKHRRHIPTMAGSIILVSLALVTLLFNLDRGQTWILLAAVLGAGALGLLDDIINLTTTKGLAGLNTKVKFGLMLLIASLVTYWFVVKLGYGSIHIPFGGDITLAAPLIAGLFIFVIVATANAVNITDGLDGLAGGLLLAAYGAFGLIAFMQGNFGIAGFCMTVCGTLLSYLWFNIFPARFFMGDVGSFALGTGLAVVAIMTNTVFLIPVIGVLFVLEVSSSLIQILSKKILKRKLFLSAPIHHHFEAKGWPETKVTMRFWILGQVAAVVGMLLAVLGGHVTL